MVRNALPFYNDGEPDTKDDLTLYAEYKVVKVQLYIGVINTNLSTVEFAIEE